MIPPLWNTDNHDLQYWSMINHEAPYRLNPCPISSHLILQADQFLVQDLAISFELDAAVTSHPIVVPVSHPDQINEVFDSISYSKVRRGKLN